MGKIIHKAEIKQPCGAYPYHRISTKCGTGGEGTKTLLTTDWDLVTCTTCSGFVCKCNCHGGCCEL